MAGQFRENWKRMANKLPPVNNGPTANEDKDLVRIEDLNGFAGLVPSSGALIVGSGSVWTKLPIGPEGFVPKSINGFIEWRPDVSGAATITVVNSIASSTGNTFTIGAQYFNSIASGTENIFMPLTPASGQTHVIKDAAGIAGTTPLTINGNGNTIDGSGTQQINTNYGSFTLIFGITEWNIV